MKQWRCKICGYIHHGTAPPPECPVCGAGPEYFVEYLPGAARPVPPASVAALLAIPSGLFVVSSYRDFDPPAARKYNGMINNTLFQITDAPLQLVLGIDKQHLTTEYIQASRVFAVNFLSPEQLPMVRQFGFKSGRQFDKFAGIDWREGATGAPLLNGTPGYLEARLQPDQPLDAGTHLVFLAEVVAGAMTPEATLLSYQEYRRRKRELWVKTNG